MAIFKIHEIDNGFCRITYKTTNSDNQKIYYCLQEDFNNQPCNFYRCTNYPWCEPSHQVALKRESIFEYPFGNSEIEIAVRKWIDNNDLAIRFWEQRFYIPIGEAIKNGYEFKAFNVDERSWETVLDIKTGFNEEIDTHYKLLGFGDDWFSCYKDWVVMISNNEYYENNPDYLNKVNEILERG